MHTFPLNTLPDRSRAYPGPSRTDYLRGITLWVSKAGRLLMIWQQRYAERQAMAALEPHRLVDIGLTRDEIAREAAKPFWRA